MKEDDLDLADVSDLESIEEIVTHAVMMREVSIYIHMIAQ